MVRYRAPLNGGERGGSGIGEVDDASRERVFRGAEGKVGDETAVARSAGRAVGGGGPRVAD